ncbi:MAG: hypothetical protein ACFFCS_25235 [Candidatus Hodarchaeota archaeon]
MRKGLLRMLFTSILAIAGIFFFIFSRFMVHYSVLDSPYGNDLLGYLDAYNYIFGSMTNILIFIYVILPSLIVVLVFASQMNLKVKIYSIRLISVMPIVFSAFQIVINGVALMLGSGTPEPEFLVYLNTYNLFNGLLVGVYAGIILLTGIKVDLKNEARRE